MIMKMFKCLRMLNKLYFSIQFSDLRNLSIKICYILRIMRYIFSFPDPVFYYTAMVRVSFMHLNKWAKPFAGKLNVPLYLLFFYCNIQAR